MEKLENKKRKITIAHLHVWDKKNKGDLAIVLAVQELLHSFFPACRIVDYPVSLLKEGTLDDAKKINKADFIVIGGGGIFYSYFLPYNHEFISALTSPLFIFGAGYIKEVDAPALSKKAAESVSFLANLAKAVGVRDNNTKKFLIANGVKTTKIKVIGDPAAFLKEKKSNNESLQKLKLSNLGKNNNPIRIGLNLNYSGWLGFGKWRDDILNSYREVISFFQEFAILKNRQLEIYYLKHHPGEENIYKELGVKDIRLVDLSPAEHKYIYGQLDLIIGMMLHVGVMAFGAKTAEISVAYDLRNYSFAEFIKCPELVIDLNKLKKGILLNRAKEVFNKKEKYEKLFEKTKLTILKKQEDFLSEIKKFL